MYEFFKEGNLFTNACFALEEMKWIEMVEATKKQGWRVSRKTRQKFPVRFPNFTSAFDRPPETPPNPPGVLCGFLFPFLAFFSLFSCRVTQTTRKMIFVKLETRTSGRRGLSG
jgi:hypothetical protein